MKVVLFLLLVVSWSSAQYDYLFLEKGTNNTVSASYWCLSSQISSLTEICASSGGQEVIDTQYPGFDAQHQSFASTLVIEEGEEDRLVIFGMNTIATFGKGTSATLIHCVNTHCGNSVQKVDLVEAGTKYRDLATVSVVSSDSSLVISYLEWNANDDASTYDVQIMRCFDIQCNKKYGPFKALTLTERPSYSKLWAETDSGTLKGMFDISFVIML